MPTAVSQCRTCNPSQSVFYASGGLRRFLKRSYWFWSSRPQFFCWTGFSIQMFWRSSYFIMRPYRQTRLQNLLEDLWTRSKKSHCSSSISLLLTVWLGYQSLPWCGPLDLSIWRTFHLFRRFLRSPKCYRSASQTLEYLSDWVLKLWPKHTCF